MHNAPKWHLRIFRPEMNARTVASEMRGKAIAGTVGLQMPSQGNLSHESKT
jgi:hypothetical protein